MTRMTNARVAGFTFLFYILVGITSLVVSGRVMHGAAIAHKLASIAQHTTEVRVLAGLYLLTAFSAIVLGVTLYAITREQDRDLALVALTCRVVEGINNVKAVSGTLALLWLGTTAGENLPSTEATRALGAYLLRGDGISAIFFAVGSTIFSWLLLRGRMIPVALAWLGVLASALVVVILTLQLLGLFARGGGWSSAVTWLIWFPMLVFEVTLALWLLIKGVATPTPR
jgi:hypothetical protein